ncbi:MAG: hypothetical protein ABEJ56_06020 [Candidatus Nanohaloarchaea archaeon]
MVSAVFDSTSLILTAKIELLALLSREMNIMITPTVKEESTVMDSPDAKMIDQQIQKERINIAEPGDGDIKNLVENYKLDSGEASSIALYRRKKAELLATDDGKAIEACRIMEISYTTSLKLLQRAEEKSVINEEQAIAKLEELDDYGWYKTRHIEKTREKIEREKNE